MKKDFVIEGLVPQGHHSAAVGHEFRSKRFVLKDNTWLILVVAFKKRTAIQEFLIVIDPRLAEN